MQPLLIYDAKCSVCVRQVRNLRAFVGDRFDLDSFRHEGFSLRHPEVPLSEAESSIQFLSKNGRRYSGAEAVARVMGLRWFFLPAMMIYYIPGLRWFWDKFYEVIARNRFWISEKWN